MDRKDYITMDREAKKVIWQNELSTYENIERSIRGSEDNPVLRRFVIQEIARKVDDYNKVLKEAQERVDIIAAERDRLDREIKIAYKMMVEAKAEANLLRRGSKLTSEASESE